MPAQLANRLGEITAGGAETFGPTNPSDGTRLCRAFFFQAECGGRTRRLGRRPGGARWIGAEAGVGGWARPVAEPPSPLEEGERTEKKKGGPSPPPSDWPGPEGPDSAGRATRESAGLPTIALQSRSRPQPLSSCNTYQIPPGSGSFPNAPHLPSSARYSCRSGRQ